MWGKHYLCLDTVKIYNWTHKNLKDPIYNFIDKLCWLSKQMLHQMLAYHNCDKAIINIGDCLIFNILITDKARKLLF